jgi:hypothetical protein
MAPSLIARPMAHLVCCANCGQFTPHPIIIDLDFDERESLCQACVQALCDSFTPYRAVIHAMVFIGEYQKGFEVIR